jgi:hypothetical protein
MRNTGKMFPAVTFSMEVRLGVITAEDSYCDILSYGATWSGIWVQTFWSHEEWRLLGCYTLAINLGFLDQPLYPKSVIYWFIIMRV